MMVSLNKNFFDFSIILKFTGYEFLKRPEPCPVCGDVITGLHYGVRTCESCKLFFKRTIQFDKQITYDCSSDTGLCNITVDSRAWCRYCRFRKCIRVGMKTNMVRHKHIKLPQNWLLLGDSGWFVRKMFHFGRWPSFPTNGVVHAAFAKSLYLFAEKPELA